MPKLKENTITPTEVEDIAINAGIKKDKDTYELNASEFKKLKAVGRPKQEITKKSTTLRIDDDVLETFKATGKGWQTKINEALHEWLDMQTWIENSRSSEVVSVALLIESQIEKDSTKVAIKTVQDITENNFKLKVTNPQAFEKDNDNKLTVSFNIRGRGIPISTRRSRNQTLLLRKRFATILRKKADEKHSA